MRINAPRREALTPLQRARKARGITQAAIADACGVTRMAVTYWELGRREPSNPKVRQLYAKTLRVSLAELGRLVYETAAQTTGAA